MIRAHVFGVDGGVRCGVPVEEALEAPEGSSVWLDVESPGEAEQQFLVERLHFHPLAVEDCVHEQRRAKLERYPSHAFVVLCALDRTTQGELLDTTPICIFVRPRLVVSVRVKRITAVERVVHIVEAEPDRVGNTTERVLHALVDAVIDEFMPLIEDWEDALDALNARASHAREPGLMDELVRLRRELLVSRRIMLPHVEIIRRLTDDAATEVSADYRIYFRDVLDHALVVAETTSLLLEVANGAISMHANAVNERINEVMKFLAIVSTLLLPWTVVSGIFGMNFDVIPLTHHPEGFIAALVIMLGGTGVLLQYFRRKGWMRDRPGRDDPRRP